MKRETEQLIYLLAEVIAVLIFVIMFINKEFPYRLSVAVVSFLMVCVFFVAYSLTGRYKTKEIIKMTSHMLGFTQ